MFDIGIGELALLGLLVLIVLGPKRLPEIARGAGMWVGRIRRFVASVKEDFDQELRTEELAELRKLQSELTETRQFIQRSSSDALESLQRNLDDEVLAGAAKPKAKRKSSRRSSATTKKKKRPATTRAKRPSGRKKNVAARKSRRR
ncbi:MAG: Sec-independent protein translocase protein TatB [Acidiferrobacterales bacterium]